jgi:hypothetical protein
MRRLIPVAALVLATGCITPGPGPDVWEPPRERRQSNFLIGLVSFEDDDFRRTDDQVLAALDYTEPIGLGPLRLEGGIHFSYDESSERLVSGMGERTRADMLELSAGLLYTLQPEDSRLLPYAGLGASLYFLQMRGLDDQREEVFRDSDSTAGGYGKIGILFRTSPGSHVGIEYRRGLGGDVSIDSRDITVDYHSVALVFGTNFQ